MQEVSGSIPLSSTTLRRCAASEAPAARGRVSARRVVSPEALAKGDLSQAERISSFPLYEMLVAFGSNALEYPATLPTRLPRAALLISAASHGVSRMRAAADI